MRKRLLLHTYPRARRYNWPECWPVRMLTEVTRGIRTNRQGATRESSVLYFAVGNAGHVTRIALCECRLSDDAVESNEVFRSLTDLPCSSPTRFWVNTIEQEFICTRVSCFLILGCVINNEIPPSRLASRKEQWTLRLANSTHETPV